VAPVLRESPIAFIVDDPGTRAGCEVKIGNVDQACRYRELHGGRSNPGSVPISAITRVTTSGKGDPAILGRFREIEFGYASPNGERTVGSWCSKRPFELARLNLILLAGKFINHRYANLGIANTIAQLRARYHWIFSPLKLRMPSSKGLILGRCPRVGKECASKVHGCSAIPFLITIR